MEENLSYNQPIADTLPQDLVQAILNKVPQKPPFRFIDGLTEISEDFVRGFYRFKENELFYEGHFPEFPVTPGVILTETMAQIGLVTLGIFCLGMHKGETPPVKIFFTSSDVRFQKMVLPGDLVWVESKKLFFRLRKLQCEVTMKNSEGEVVCSGTLSGMMVPDNPK